MHTAREHEVFKRVRRVHAALAVTEETLRARVEYARGSTWSTLPARARELEVDTLLVGPHRYCSPRQRHAFGTLVSRIKRHPMTWRAISARP